MGGSASMMGGMKSSMRDTSLRISMLGDGEDAEEIQGKVKKIVDLAVHKVQQAH